jgi:hypothetical protein
MVSASNTNITPAKLEEFEATFKHFDKDDTNVRESPGLGLTEDAGTVGNAFGFGGSGDCICGLWIDTSMTLY